MAGNVAGAEAQKRPVGLRRGLGLPGRPGPPLLLEKTHVIAREAAPGLLAGLRHKARDLPRRRPEGDGLHRAGDPGPPPDLGLPQLRERLASVGLRLPRPPKPHPAHLSPGLQGLDRHLIVRQGVDFPEGRRERPPYRA
jgi:hypothetical protein